jgi:hypothetical protein
MTHSIQGWHALFASSRGGCFSLDILFQRKIIILYKNELGGDGGFASGGPKKEH